jgi:signal transduction histidine kinase/ActR/RegA family two-component response regulator
MAAYEEMDIAAAEASSARSWRGWGMAAAILASILLVALALMVDVANGDREKALALERHTRDVLRLSSMVDATVSRSEATLGRYVMDEEPETGRQYYDEWRRAGQLIGMLKRRTATADQAARVADLERLYDQRGRELAIAAAAAAQGKGSGGLPLFYQAGRSPTGRAIRNQLDKISAGEQQALEQRTGQTLTFSADADRLAEWLGWIAVIVGAGAIVLALLAYGAATERLAARREAEDEASRAFELERAVDERTRELVDANERLREEAAERAAAEAQLHQAQKMEAVGQLTGGIAHDFNNMLSVVVGGVDLARRKLGTSKREALLHLDNAMEGATRAAALTRRLLAFARSEPLLPEAVAPGTLVEGMLELVDRSLGERIAVETHFAAEPWPVWADPNQLENAILNLCVNGRDAMEGEGRLLIAVDNLSLADGEAGGLPAGHYVRIAVTDSGTGIAPENLGRVFEPFFTTKPIGKGTGLGLSQIFGFARQSGGDVTVQSRLGEGTTVALYLPRAAEGAAQARERQVHSGTGEAAHAPAPAGTAILVVEDDPRVRGATVSALEELGYLATPCASGAEALELLERTGRIDLVITDVMMPEMTGPELVRRLALTHPQLAILFVSGFLGEAGDASELAGYDMLRKPFTVSGLAEAVAAALSRVSGSPGASAAEAAE